MAPDRTELPNECRHPEHPIATYTITLKLYTTAIYIITHKSGKLGGDTKIFVCTLHKFLLSAYTTTHNSLSTYIIKQKSSCLPTPPHENPPVYLHHHTDSVYLPHQKSSCLLTHHTEIALSTYPITQKSSCLLTPSHRNPPVYLHHHTEIYLHHQNPWRRACR